MRGTCYHSALLRYKTETLLHKWREGWGSVQQRLAIAYELSFRDPDLALAEVSAALARCTHAGKRKTLRRCLHHVADIATARMLFSDGDFDPDALHLSPFAALLDDFLAALPSLAPPRAEAWLRRLGFLQAEVPNPLADPDRGSGGDGSHERYQHILVHFLSEALGASALVQHRDHLADHLRTTYAASAYAFLLACWTKGALSAIAVIAAVPRLGHAVASSQLHGRLDEMVRELLVQLAGPPAPFELAALENGWFPEAVAQFSPDHARAITIAILDQPRLAPLHTRAGSALLDSHPLDVLDRAARLPLDLVGKAAAAVPYAEARDRLHPVHDAILHPALVHHPGAPPDRGLLARANELMTSDPAVAMPMLTRIAKDLHHPDRQAAFDRVLRLARDSTDPSARRYALHALGQIGDARGGPILLGALADPELADARLLIESALTELNLSDRTDAHDEVVSL